MVIISKSTWRLRSHESHLFRGRLRPLAFHTPMPLFSTGKEVVAQFCMPCRLQIRAYVHAHGLVSRVPARFQISVHHDCGSAAKRLAHSSSAFAPRSFLCPDSFTPPKVTPGGNLQFVLTYTPLVPSGTVQRNIEAHTKFPPAAHAQHGAHAPHPA